MIGPGSVSGTGSKPITAQAERDLAWHSYVSRCSTGEQSALESLYDETSSYVYGVALGILRDPADADEVTLDVYSQVWRSAAVYSAQRGSVLAWLLTLARSRAIDRLRSRSSRNRREEVIGDDAPAVFCAGGDSPEQSAAHAQMGSRVRLALDALPAEQRQLVELAYFHGMSHAELASHLGQPLGTVKTRIRMGMMKLKLELQEIYG